MHTRKRLPTLYIVFALLLAGGSTPPGAAEARQVVTKFADGAVKARYDVDAEGRKQGTYRQFHPNGKPEIVAQYRDDQLSGPYSQWDADGQRVETAQYRAGKRHGWCRRYQNGAVISERAFVDGVVVYPKSLAAIRKQLDVIAKTPVPGATSGPVVEAVRRLMAYRYLCDVPFEGMRVDEQMARQAQAAAEICRRLGKLSHRPDNPGLDDQRYELARFGAAHSNLSMGSSVPGSVDAYMNDSDKSNIDRVGHRRWCLFPPMQKTALGAAGRYSALRVGDRSRKDIPDYDLIAYPPRGFLPLRYLSGHPAWSLTLNPGRYAKPDKDSVKVSIHPIGPGQDSIDAFTRATPLPLDSFNVDHGGYGIPNGIIFRPVNLKYRPGDRYWVRVQGVKTRQGAPTELGYLVEFVR